MHEEICDQILRKLTEKNPTGHSEVWESTTLASSLGFPHDDVFEALRFLKQTGYIVSHVGPQEVEGMQVSVASVKIKDAGRIFIADSSFVDNRDKAKWKTELSNKEHRKLEQEIKLNAWLLKTKWWPLIISILSLVVAIYAVWKAK